MANQKQIAIGYCLLFIAVYILYILYLVVGGYINTINNQEIVPSTLAMNATTNATMALADVTGMSWFMIVIIVGGIAIILGLIFTFLGRSSMASAY